MESADRVQIEDVRTMTGGAARESWRLDVELERAVYGRLGHLGGVPELSPADT